MLLGETIAESAVVVLALPVSESSRGPVPVSDWHQELLVERAEKEPASQGSATDEDRVLLEGSRSLVALGDDVNEGWKPPTRLQR